MALEFYEVPLTPRPQKFTIFLGKTQWSLVLRWNHVANHWTLDFLTAKNEPVLMGMLITTGVDLLVQHRHLGFEGSLIAQSSSDPLRPPSFENMGVTSHLIFAYEVEGV